MATGKSQLLVFAPYDGDPVEILLAPADLDVNACKDAYEAWYTNTYLPAVRSVPVGQPWPVKYVSLYDWMLNAGATRDLDQAPVTIVDL